MLDTEGGAEVTLKGETGRSNCVISTKLWYNQKEARFSGKPTVLECLNCFGIENCLKNVQRLLLLFQISLNYHSLINLEQFSNPERLKRHYMYVVNILIIKKYVYNKSFAWMSFHHPIVQFTSTVHSSTVWCNDVQFWALC